MLSPIYLVGGAIRDLMLANIPKDLDFVVVGEEHLEWVMLVLKKFNIEYSLNRFGGFKINYNGVMVDLWITNDLFSSMQYNVDGLYFNLKHQEVSQLL